MKSNLRLCAARILECIKQGKSLTVALNSDEMVKTLSQRDRAFVKEISFGVCRFYPTLQFILRHFLTKPLPHHATLIEQLLYVGLYQLRYMRVPAHAALNETVSAASVLKTQWAKSLINAILRRYLREEKNIESAISADPVATYSHPKWLIAAIKEAWPANWEDILTANNDHPPFAVRQRPGTPLPANGIAIEHTTQGFFIPIETDVITLDAFKRGELQVQDGAAQLAAPLLKLQPGQRVLDACSAPGGKLIHLLELEPHLHSCLAIDSDSERMKQVAANLERNKLQTRCVLKVADAGETATYWDGNCFDRILLDAPCSGTGVIRRHPDIKLLRSAQDVQQNAHKQLKLLQALWETLAPGGILLYVTCSILPAENAALVEAFLAKEPSASEDKILADWGIPCQYGRQILPGNVENMDGFYYARLRKLLAQ